LKLFADGSYTYAADRANDLILGESGTDSFTYELSDGDGGTATGSFTAEVSGRDETMVGNAGADVMTGGRGADSLKGLEGPDVLRGHAGEDRLQGGVGDDTLDGGADGDRLEGGDGNDFYRRITSGDVIVETPGEGLDTVSTGGDFTLADGISIERIVGIGPADLTLIGNSSANVIRGAEGANSLSGGGADDTVKGGAGDDTMDGGLGRDCLGGGAGADTFQFADAIRATEFPAQDRVLDFSAAEGDVIDLSPNDARPDEGDQAFTFLGTGGYTGAGGEVRIQFLGNGARVMADVDGNRASDFSLFLRGVSALTADDFAL
jgi:Ca2+-binding RTX toxin-like protein